jgi:uncharacterized protein involved in exopolysaccharide biosynthesis
MAEETQKKTPRDLLRAVFRRRLLFLISAGVFAFVALVGSCWWPLKYTAVAKFERKADAASEDLVRGKSESFDALKMTLMHEISGTGALEEAVDGLEKKGLLPVLPRDQNAKLTSEGQRRRQDLVNSLIDDLKINFEVRSQEVDIVSVTFTDPDPQIAQQLPNILVTNYINRTSEQMVSNLTSSRDFLQTKVDETNTRFVELTRKRIDFETKFAGMLPDNPAALQQEIQRIGSDIETAGRQRVLAKQKLDQIKIILGEPAAQQTNGATAPATTDSQGASSPEKAAEASEPSVEQDYRDATQELAHLQDQQQQYQKSLDESRTLLFMTEKHPRVISLKKQIEDLDKRITVAKGRVSDLEKRMKDIRALAVQSPIPIDTALDPARQRDYQLHQAQLAMEATSAQSEYQLLSNDIERLQARQAELQKVMASYGPVRQEYLGIIKEVTDQQAEVDRWQRRLNEVQMALAAEAAKHRTHLNQVELAKEQSKPSSPKLLYVLALALVGGLAFGGGLVFLTNAMDRSIATTEEAVDHFSLPVLGTIGEISTPRQLARRKMLRWGVGPVVVLVAALAIGMAALNIAVWLNYRDQYSAWRSAPVKFVISKIGSSITGRF